jgi:plasmid maintenance system killer protein
MHPALKAKKYDEGQDIWQARVNRDWRFYFQFKGSVWFLIDITKAPKITLF